MIRYTLEWACGYLLTNEKGDGMKKTILVVDDDRTNLIIAERLLSEEYKVVSVLSGQQALKFLEKKRPNLILLDINMPGMDGFELMRIIRENEAWEKIPVIFLTADREADTEVHCLKMGAVDFVGKPFEPEIIKNRIRRTLEIEEYRKDLEGAVRRQTLKIERMQREVIISMANMIESRDGSTGEHVKRTSLYVTMIAEELERQNLFSDIIDERFLYNLEKAAPMHDIGKIKVPDHVLQKPGKLTDEEFEIMKKHSADGGQIIRETMGNIEEEDYLQVAYNVATYHHEKWNGTGYPDRISGEQIPLEARIMAVADVFDALISKRCYKDAMSLDKAFDIIEESAGTHFDPQIAKVFLELRPDIEKSLQENA